MKNNWKISLFICFLMVSFLIKIPLDKLGSINLMDIILVLSLLMLTFDLSKRKILGNFLHWSKNLWPLAFVLLGVTLSFLINFSNQNFWHSLGLVKSFYFLPILFCAFIIFYLEQKIFAFEKILFGFFFYIQILGILGLIYILKQELAFDGRLQLFFNSPNYLAGLLALGLLVGMALFFFNNDFSFFNKNLKQNNFLFFILITFFPLLALFYTRSLGSFLGFLASILFIFILKKGYPCFEIFYKKTLLVLAILSFLIIFGLPIFLKLFSYSPHISPDSTDSRIAIYLATAKIIQAHPLFGIGSVNFQEVYLAYQKYFPPYPQWAVPHTHNIFATLWLETGLLGLIGVLFIFYKWSFLGQKKTASQEVALINLLLIYFLVHGTVDSIYWRNDLALIFWFALIYAQILCRKGLR